jgi:hypothetical protein
MCKGRLWKNASVSIGAPFGNLEGGSFTEDFERQKKEVSKNGPALCELCEGSFTGDSEGDVKEGSGDWHRPSDSIALYKDASEFIFVSSYTF